MASVVKLGGSVRACTFSPCDRFVAVGGYDNAVSVIRLCDRAVVTRVARAGPVWTISWSPNGCRLVVGGMDCKISVIDPFTGRVLHETIRDQWIYASSWSRDGRRLAAGGLANGRVCRSLVVVDAESSAAVELDVGRAASVWCVAFSPDSTRLAVATSDGRCACLLADGRGALFETRIGRDAAKCVVYTGDGAALAVGHDAGVAVLDALSGVVLVDCPSTSKVLSCAFIDATSLLVARFGSFDIALLEIAGRRATFLTLPEDAPGYKTPDHPPGRAAVNALAITATTGIVAFARSDGLVGFVPLHHPHQHQHAYSQHTQPSSSLFQNSYDISATTTGGGHSRQDMIRRHDVYDSSNPAAPSYYYVAPPPAAATHARRAGGGGRRGGY